MRRTRDYSSHTHFLITSLALGIALVLQIGYTPQVRAQVIIDVIELGDEGGGVAVNSDTNRVYACVGAKLNVYDAQTHALVTSITIPQNYTPCYDVAVNTLTNRVYAAGLRTFVIDGNTNAVLANFDTDGEEIAVNSATNRIYISERSDYPYTDPSVVHVLNGANNTWLPDIIVGTPTTFEYTHLAANPTTNRVYIAFTGDDNLRVLDGSTHTEVTRLPMENIGYVAVNPVTNRVYMGMNYTDVSVLDGVTHTQVGSISRFGGKLQVNPLTNRIYSIWGTSPGYVVRIADLTTNRVVGYVHQDGNWADFDIHQGLGKLFGSHATYSGTWGKKMTIIQDASPTSPAPEPDPPAVIATLDLPEAGDGIAVNTLTDHLYVGVDGGISIFDATTLDSLSYIALSEDPDWPPVYDVGVDEARNQIYAVTVSGTYVINGTNNQVIGTLGSGNEIAVNQDNGRVYIADTGVWLGEPDVVKIYDGVGLSYIRTITLGTSSYFQSVSVAINPTTGYAYCTYSLDDDLRVISPSTDDVILTLDYTSIGDVTVDPVTNRVYVWISRSGQSGALILDGNTHAELGMIQGVSGQLEISPQTNRLYGYTGYTLFQAYDGANGGLLSRVFLDGDINDYTIHPGLSRLYVTHYDYPAEWANKVSVIQDADTLMVLTVSKTGSGSGTVSSSPGGIDCGSTCFHGFLANTVVTLTATPISPSTFGGWSGAGCSGTGACTVTMNTAKYATAIFNNPGNKTLTVSKSGTGSGTVISSPAGINCGLTCSYAFTTNTSVTLIAAAVSGSTFTGWSGSGCSGTGTCTLNMDVNKSVTANFTYIGAYVISGNVGAGGVTLRYTDGQPQKTKSDSRGDYSITVTSGWSGTVTPIDLCYIFSPPNRSYTNVTADKTGQDYTATAVTCYMNYLPLTMK